MWKKILAFVVMLSAAVAFAAVDVNKATAAELDSIKGIGPVISGKILDERKKGNFKDWGDFIERVKGVGQGNAVKFSSQGLTVGGSAYKTSAASPTPAVAIPAVVPASAAADKNAKTDGKMTKKMKAEAAQPAASAAKK